MNNEEQEKTTETSMLPALEVVVRRAVADAIRQEIGGSVEDRPPLLLDIHQVARALGVGQSTVRRLIASGELRSVRCMRAIRVRMEDIEAMLKRTEDERDQGKDDDHGTPKKNH